MRAHQEAYSQFMDERPNLNRNPFFMQNQIHEENEEMLSAMGEPGNMTLWQYAELRGELADVYWYLIGIASAYGIDLMEAAETKIEYNRQRFHPNETYEESKIREGRPLHKPLEYTPPFWDDFPE